MIQLLQVLSFLYFNIHHKVNMIKLQFISVLLLQYILIRLSCTFYEVS